MYEISNFERNRDGKEGIGVPRVPRGRGGSKGLKYRLDCPYG